MITIGTKQMRDGTWSCYVTVNGYDVQESGFTIKESQDKMCRTLMMRGEDVDGVEFSDPKWREYNPSEIRKRFAVNKIDDFTVGSVVQCCPDDIIDEPYYGVVVSRYTGEGDYLPNIIIDIPGHHSRCISNNEEWQWFMKKFVILGSKQQYNHLLVAQVLKGLKEFYVY